MRIGPRGSASRQLRALLAREKPLLALGAFNAVSARVVEAAGFPVVSPRLTTEALREIGVALAIFPGALSRVSVQAMYEFAAEFRRRGPSVETEFTERTRAHPFGSLHEFAGFGQIRRWEEEFLPAEELGKYAATLGHQPGQSAGTPADGPPGFPVDPRGAPPTLGHEA